MSFHKLIRDIGIPPTDAAYLSELYHLTATDTFFTEKLCQVKAAAFALDSGAGQTLISEIAAHFNRPEYGIEALCLLHIALDAKQRYDALGIDTAIYTDCMADIATWMRMCKKETGEIGTLHNFGWCMQPMLPRIIKLGRLQFEMIVLKERPQIGKPISYTMAMPGNIPSGIPALHVHIPEGEPLSHGACLASYERAKRFFPDIFGFAPEYFFCHSWLLAPELKEILPPQSNILKFASDFTILYTDADAAWRIFGSRKPWPQETSLQHAAKIGTIQATRSAPDLA